MSVVFQVLLMFGYQILKIFRVSELYVTSYVSHIPVFGFVRLSVNCCLIQIVFEAL